MKMVAKLSETKYICVIILCIIVLSAFVSAKLTATIGNSRMILRLNEGESIDKCILIKNVNDADVEIQLTPAGDLAEYITFEEQKFTLPAGSEKKACFTITAEKEGTTETKVNVLFSPVEDENGKSGSSVGLSSTIIVIAKKKTSFFDNFFGNENQDGKNNKFNLFIVSLMITAILFVLLLVLIFSRKKHHVSAIEQTKIEQTKSGVKVKLK